MDDADLRQELEILDSSFKNGKIALFADEGMEKCKRQGNTADVNEIEEQ